MLKKDYLNAMKNLELGLELNPEHLLIMNSLGVCYMNVGLYDKSEEVLQKAYEIDKYAITVALDNYPNIIECGDAFDVRKHDWKY